MRCLALFCLAIGLSGPAVANELECGSFRIDGDSLDLAPLPGFVEVCSRHAELCDALTRAYPPSVTTLGYFVTEDEWARFEETEELGFRVYLIAQTGGRDSDEEFQQLKGYIKAQQGQLPDNTELPSFIEKHGLSACCRVVFNSNEFLYVD